MTKHTPGPWTQTGQDIVSETLRETLSSGRKIRLRIANAKDAGGKLDLETVKANAALIAAAPELLEALKDLRLAATAHGVKADNPANIAARAAIAKAESGQ